MARMLLSYCYKRGADIVLDLTMFMFAHRELEIIKFKKFSASPVALRPVHFTQKLMGLNQDHVIHLTSLFTVSFFNKFLSHMKNAFTVISRFILYDLCNYNIVFSYAR
jgi:hypothetical protein